MSDFMGMYFERHGVLTAMLLKTLVFGDITPC